MAPAVIDIQSEEDKRDVVHRAVQVLVEGDLVAFPTETVYGIAASALNAAAVEKLIDIKGRKTNHPMTLAIHSAEESLDYIPTMSPIAQRLARRCWPGPVTLVVEDNHPNSLTRQLPQSVQRAVIPGSTIGMRVPAHPTILDVMHMLSGPLVLTSANRGGQAESITAQEIVQIIGDDVQLVLDDGKCRFGQPSSVVQVSGNQLKILRSGVVAEIILQRLSSLMILFVCTGNTCRSPMADVICRDLIAKRMKCSIDELDDKGVVVMSAGIAAMMGGRASVESVAVMSAAGLDLTKHQSQPITERLVHHADFIFTMTRNHRDAIVASWPNVASRTLVLSPDGNDVSDPIGGPMDMYQRCSAQIQQSITARLDEFNLPKSGLAIL